MIKVYVNPNNELLFAPFVILSFERYLLTSVETIPSLSPKNIYKKNILE